jgi:hypothetical protein
MTVKITPTLAESWLKDIGCTPREVVPRDPAASFQFESDYPAGTPHRIHTLSPVATPRALMVVTGVTLSPEHVARFRDLENQEKADFLQDLTTTLNREFVEFNFGPTPPMSSLECPSVFQIQATRYDDGLSLDSFARTISSVYKAELAGIACVQRHLAPLTSGGPGGQFPFKRLGSLQ